MQHNNSTQAHTSTNDNLATLDAESKASKVETPLLTNSSKVVEDQPKEDQSQLLEGGEYDTPVSANQQSRTGKQNQIGAAEGPMEDDQYRHQPSGSIMRYNTDEQFLNNDLVEEDSIILKETENIGCYLIFKLDERLFKFRGTQMPAG